MWKQPRPSDAYGENEHSYASPTLYRDGEQAFLLTHQSRLHHREGRLSTRWAPNCGGAAGCSRPVTIRRCGWSRPRSRSRDSSSPPARQSGGGQSPFAPVGPGDITHNPNFKPWSFFPTPDVPSPLVVDDLVYLLRENSVLICVDAKTGEKLYEQRTAISE